MLASCTTLHGPCSSSSLLLLLLLLASCCSSCCCSCRAQALVSLALRVGDRVSCNAEAAVCCRQRQVHGVLALCWGGVPVGESCCAPAQACSLWQVWPRHAGSCGRPQAAGRSILLGGKLVLHGRICLRCCQRVMLQLLLLLSLDGCLVVPQDHVAGRECVLRHCYLLG